MQLTLEKNLSESSVSLNIALSGVPVPTTATESRTADLYWKFDDEDSEPQWLGSTAVGTTLAVPFTPTGRPVRLYMVTRTEDGFASDRALLTAEQTLITPDLFYIVDDGDTAFIIDDESSAFIESE